MADLVPRFGLETYLDHGAASLPLGVRQRLSLAAAVIHAPDILILDEPTSGVDPQARDAFWDMLLDLARRDQVTIFISTHFMDEGMRCDRISLMHAGMVLMTGAPQEIIEARDMDSLEDAFIAHTLDAIPQEAEADAELRPVETPEHTIGTQRFSLRHILANTAREAMQVRRDPVRLAFSFIGSAVLLLIMSFGISQEVHGIPFAAFDLGRSPESRAYLSGFKDSEWFRQMPPIRDAGDLTRAWSVANWRWRCKFHPISAPPCGAMRRRKLPR